MVTGWQTLFLLRRKRKRPLSTAVFGFDGSPVKIPKTACLTRCSHKSPSVQIDHAVMEAQGHRAFSGTCDRLTSAGEQGKSGSV
ncbi:hypothetical protein DER46DRAFT_619074, partial [Fusarium sp. MPI-SDFR-AT-0072]